MGFWSTLATIGTALIPGVGPFLAPVVGGLVNGLTNKPAATSTAAGSGTATTSALIDPAAQQAIDNSRSSPSTQAEGYYQRALGGDQQQLQQLLGPEISTVLSQYDTAAKTASNLSPRGGGRTQTLSELPFQKVAAYGQQLAGARSGAADKLGALGEADANREAGIGTSLIGAKSKSDELAYQKQKDSSAAYSKIGSSLGGIFTDLLKGNKSGSGGGSGSIGGIGIPGVDGAPGIDLGDF